MSRTLPAADLRTPLLSLPYAPGTSRPRFRLPLLGLESEATQYQIRIPERPYKPGSRKSTNLVSLVFRRQSSEHSLTSSCFLKQGDPVPAPGLSLVGFLDRDEALSHLRNFSVPRDNSEDALTREWMVAKSKIGEPVSNAGAPDIRSIEPPFDGYIRSLCEQRWVQTVLNRPEYKSAEFKLVEIDSLLAHQPLVYIERPDQIYGVGKVPTLSDLMRICLPSTQPRPLDPPTVFVKDWHSIIIKGRDLQIDRITPAVVPMHMDEYEQAFVGMQIWWGLPFVHAVRFNGRYYLINGYHRVMGAALRGTTHVPCFLRDSEQSSWLLMPRRLFESSNPPTLGHFLQGRAYPVALRAMSRILSISWSERLMPDEYDGI